MRMSLLALICAALLLAACTSNSGDDSSGTPEGDATAVTTATAATGASDDATASDAPTDEGDAPVLVQRFIGNTGGSGVAVRDACAQDARAGGRVAAGQRRPRTRSGDRGLRRLVLCGPRPLL